MGNANDVAILGGLVKFVQSPFKLVGNTAVGLKSLVTGDTEGFKNGMAGVGNSIFDAVESPLQVTTDILEMPKTLLGGNTDKDTPNMKKVTMGTGNLFDVPVGIVGVGRDAVNALRPGRPGFFNDNEEKSTASHSKTKAPSTQATPKVVAKSNDKATQVAPKTVTEPATPKVVNEPKKVETTPVVPPKAIEQPKKVEIAPVVPPKAIEQPKKVETTPVAPIQTIDLTPDETLGTNSDNSSKYKNIALFGGATLLLLGAFLLTKGRFSKIKNILKFGRGSSIASSGASGALSSSTLTSGAKRAKFVTTKFAPLEERVTPLPLNERKRLAKIALKRHERKAAKELAKKLRRIKRENILAKQAKLKVDKQTEKMWAQHTLDKSTQETANKANDVAREELARQTAKSTIERQTNGMWKGYHIQADKKKAAEIEAAWAQHSSGASLDPKKIKERTNRQIRTFYKSQAEAQAKAEAEKQAIEAAKVEAEKQTIGTVKKKTQRTAKVTKKAGTTQKIKAKKTQVTSLKTKKTNSKKSTKAISTDIKVSQTAQIKITPDTIKLGDKLKIRIKPTTSDKIMTAHKGEFMSLMGGKNNAVRKHHTIHEITVSESNLGQIKKLYRYLEIAAA